MVAKKTNYLNRINTFLSKYGSKLFFTTGAGGFLFLYVIENFRIKIIPNLTSLDDMYILLNRYEFTNVSQIEVIVLLISIVSLISSPLISKNGSKNYYNIFLLISLLFLEMIGIVSVIISQEITFLFLMSTLMLSLFLVWIFIDVLQIIYAWTRIEKKEEKQVDVAKLTFIWAVIVFLFGFFR